MKDCASLLCLGIQGWNAAEERVEGATEATFSPL